MFTASQILDRINNYILEQQTARTPQGLYAPMEYVLSLGGKRIRPVLMLMAYNLYKEDLSSIFSVASGIEIYHNHTLLHDDLMDRSEIRRGKPTVHKVWNDNTAILSGDAMLILAFNRMASCEVKYLNDIMSVFSQTALEICEGQQFDMEFELRDDVTESEYLEMIRLKTAVLLATSLKVGAILADAPVADADNLYDFGMQMGIAFQLQDDLLDVYGEPETFGKKIGGDILCNKKTYMLIKALEGVKGQLKETLSYWLKVQDFKPLEKISAVTEVYNELNIKKACEEKIAEYYALAMMKLDAVNVTDDKKVELKKIVQTLTSRVI